MGGSYGAPGGKSSAAAAADACGAIQVAPGSAVGQLLSKPTVMDTIKQVRQCLHHSRVCKPLFGLRHGQDVSHYGYENDPAPVLCCMPC
jgi:hypothetical protein